MKKSKVKKLYRIEYISKVFEKIYCINKKKSRHQKVYKNCSFLKEVQIKMYKKYLIFENCIFEDQVTIKPEPEKNYIPKIIFKNCIVRKKISFYSVYLGYVHFGTIDFKYLEFNNVWWMMDKGKNRYILRDDLSTYSKEKIQKMLKEDILVPDRDNTQKLENLQIQYAQLRKYYEDHEDYRNSDRFYQSEIEVKKQTSGRFFKLLVWGYQKIRGKGKSFFRPIIALLITIAVFSLLYSLIGFKDNDCLKILNQQNFCKIDGFLLIWKNHFCDVIEYTIRISFLQKEGLLTIQNFWGFILNLIQILLTAIFIGTFVLMIKRNFKR